MTLAQKVMNNIKVDPKSPALAIDPASLLILIESVMKIVFSLVDRCKQPIEKVANNPDFFQLWKLKNIISQVTNDPRTAEEVRKALISTGKVATKDELEAERLRLSFDMIS
jgi:hypothetical protein